MEQREVLDLALTAVDGNQAELARRLGRSETTVSRWVTGRNGIDFESALRLARLTGLPPHKVVEACGLDPSLVPAPPDGPIDPDAAAFLAVWPTLEDRIQYAISILAGLHPVSAQGQRGVSATRRPVTRRTRGHDGELPMSYPGAALRLARAS
jgi:transcriptional regulator with XRE-family HTH domain